MCLQNRGNSIGWQRTALAFLTPNPHPKLAMVMLAALQNIVTTQNSMCGTGHTLQ